MSTRYDSDASPRDNAVVTAVATVQPARGAGLRRGERGSLKAERRTTEWRFHTTHKPRELASPTAPAQAAPKRTLEPPRPTVREQAVRRQSRAKRARPPSPTPAGGRIVYCLPVSGSRASTEAGGDGGLGRARLPERSWDTSRTSGAAKFSGKAAARRRVGGGGGKSS